MANHHKMDLTQGVIPWQILKFMLPQLFNYLLQTVFHAADIAVVGRFAASAEHAVAAVGASGPIIGVLLCLFVGMGAGINVVIAQYMGAKDYKRVNRAVHAAILLGIVCGTLIVIIGSFFPVPMLRMTQTPEVIMEDSLKYLVITIWGMPSLLIYNFGCAVLRAAGDTRRPLNYLIISGIVNVVLNVILVVGFGWDVMGVGVATLVSKIIAMALIMQALIKSHGACRFYWNMIWKPDWKILFRVLGKGVPVGIQNACFSFANVLIAGAINSFGHSALAASTVLSFAEGGLTNATSGALYLTMVSFAGQNYGAGNMSRVWESMRWCLLYALIFGGMIGGFGYFGLDMWMAWFINDPSAEVTSFARIRAALVLLPCFISITQNIFRGTLLGLGYSVYPTLVSIFGVCIYRFIWILGIYPHYRSFGMVIVTFPISYILIIIGTGAALIWLRRTRFRNPNYKPLSS